MIDSLAFSHSSCSSCLRGVSLFCSKLGAFIGWAVILCSAFFFTCSLVADESTGGILVAEEEDGLILIYREGDEEPVLVHNVKRDFRPYIHPIVAPDGQGVLTEMSPGHHKHQTGLYWGFTRVNGRDYFHNPSADYWRYRHSALVRSRGNRLWWAVAYDLLGEDGRPILTHTDRWGLEDRGDHWILDVHWAGEAKVDLTFARYDYGGLFLRMPWTPETRGVATNSEGLRNKAVEGQRARWVDVGMPIEGRDDWGHIAILDHPENDGHPVTWRVDGELGVGPCRARLGEWKLGEGEFAWAKYRLVVYAGDLSRKTIEAAWKDLLPQPGLERGIHYNKTPQEAVEAMELPPGFKLKLVAGEPDVKQPNAFSIDDRGRLWVAENYTYSRYDWLPDRRDRILILEDTDGDGRADERKVFTEGITFVSGLEIGHGGVWVGSPPHLLFIPDRDRDDVPDGDAEVILDGWSGYDQHETLNTFQWGPDGWLYGCHGIFNESLVGKPGTPVEERQPLNAGVWRYHPVREEFEVFAWGTSNPWGFDFNDQGQMVMTACVIPHLWHVVQGARYNRQAGEHFNPYVYDDIKTIAGHSHEGFHGRGGGHAHGGAMFYLGESFPASYRGKLFMFNLHHRAIYIDALKRKGSGLVGRHDGDFLFANDPWFVGFALRYGPDGSVYLLDWYDEKICHGQTIEGKATGRIYRISYGEARRELVDLHALGDSELARLALERNEWLVRHSRRILAERAARGRDLSQAHQVLREILEQHAEVPRKLRALWALHCSDGTHEELLSGLLAAKSEFIRAWAIQLELEDREASETVVKRYAVMAREDPSAVVRLYLASALQRLPIAQRWEIAAGLLSRAEDAEDHNLPLMLWYGVEPLVAADKRRALQMARASKLPLLRRYIARRSTAK